MAEETDLKRRKRIRRLWELLIVSVGSLLFLHHAEQPPTSVRNPLKVLTPPFTADKPQIIRELRARKFHLLDTQLDSYQTAFEENVLEEENLALAFDAFRVTDTSLRPILDEWVKTEPESYPAHLARAKYLFAFAWQLRLSPENLAEAQVAQMKQLYGESVKEAAAAIKLNSKSSPAYGLIIEAAKGLWDRKTLESVYAESLRNVPLSLSTRIAVITALRPRWGGSHRAMTEFAQEAQKYAAQNPRLVCLMGFPDQDRGDIAWDQGNLGQAVGYYNKAIEEGGDFAIAYSQRGRAYDKLRCYDDALEDLTRADRLRPQDTFTLSALSYVYFYINRPGDTLATIREYQQFAALPPDLAVLKQAAENFEGGSSQSVVIGGN